MITDFGSKIKYLRGKAKMTQTELARVLGISKSAVSAYEKGNRYPSFEILKDIAHVFNVNEITFLLNDEDKLLTTVFDVTDLTFHQQETIRTIIDEFRISNHYQQLCKKEDEEEADEE